MEKQEAIDFIISELDRGCSQAEISHMLSRRLNAPLDLVAKFVARTAQSHTRLQTAPELPSAVNPPPPAPSLQSPIARPLPPASSPLVSTPRKRTLVARPLPRAIQPSSPVSPAAARHQPVPIRRPTVAQRGLPVWTGKLTKLIFRSNFSIWLGTMIVGVIILTALAAPLLAPPEPEIEFSPFKDIGEINQYKPFQPGAELWLGSVPDPTNNRQLDIWYSLVWGTRSALVFGLLVVLITGAFGVILGGVSAYLGGWRNTLIMGFTDAFLSFPLIAGVIFFQQFILMLLSSAGVTVFWTGVLPTMESPTAWQLFLSRLDPLLIAFIVFSWMPYARLTNSVVLRTRQEDYILAARAVGVRPLRLIFRHLIPNSISPIIVMAARDIGYVVLLQAGFAFIGLSQRSEWGVLLSLGRSYVIGSGGNPFTWWWTYLPPTLAIMFFGLAWNLLGDGLNDWLDPYQSRLKTQTQP